jgi:hypothetical protein
MKQTMILGTVLLLTCGGTTAKANDGFSRVLKTFLPAFGLLEGFSGLTFVVFF